MVIVFDLDDTLYNEIDFVKSGFTEIASYLGDEKYFNFLWKDFLKNGSGKNIDNLLSAFKLNEKKDKLIEIYRFHRPKIKLNNDAKTILDFLKKRKISTALLTDGHYITQKNKFMVLGLDRFINFTVFTDCYQTKKPDIKPYQIIMSHFPKERNFWYIADNPQKDFIAPLKLGWKVIRYRNKKGLYRKIECSEPVREIDNLAQLTTLLGI